MKTELECPVEFVAINENKARLTAFFVLLLVVIFLFTNLWIIPAFLIVDFSIRASVWGKYSLLGVLADAIIKQVGIKYKATDRAPKRFAALIGVIFSVPILILTLLHIALPALILIYTLAFFAFLESILGFCAGCYVYTLLKKTSRILKINSLKK